MSLISVIVPVYETACYLDRCICSLQAQTLIDLEIILVDDESSDHSGALCDEYASRNGRITVIHQPHGGVPSARNAGLDAARGDYVAFVDSDDWAEPELFETLYDLAAGKNADLAACGYTIHHPGGWCEELFLETDELALSPGDALEQLLHTPSHEGYLVGKLFRRSLLQQADEGAPLRFHPEFHHGGDQLFAVQYNMQAETVWYSGKSLYHRFVREESLSFRYDAVRISELDARERICRLLGPLSITLNHLAAKRYMYSAINLMIHAVHAGETASIPPIRRLALSRMWDFWHNPETTWKNKLRALTVLAFPVWSTRIWYSLKELFGLVWEDDG